MNCELILGGARSGKSRHAQYLAQETGWGVTVIATATADDAEMAERIHRHRAERPVNWHTHEEPTALATALRQTAAPEHCIIVDCITLWLTNLLKGAEHLPAPTNPHTLHHLQAEYDALLTLLPTLPGKIILVANELGLGIVPDTPLGRLFRDEAGRLNQALATCCTRVTFIAAGLPFILKDSTSHPV